MARRKSGGFLQEKRRVKGDGGQVFQNTDLTQNCSLKRIILGSFYAKASSFLVDLQLYPDF